MITIILPPELESVLTEQAQRQGVTPETIALDSLRNQFLPVAPAPPAEGTLADYLADFIGSIHSSEVVPGGANMSENIGKKFAEGMAKKRREGRL